MPGGRLELSLLDQDGKVIHSYTYTGDVTGAMMGVADNFTPDKTYGTFTLDAKLYEGEKLVDQSSVTYDCENLDPSLCPVESVGFLVARTSSPRYSARFLRSSRLGVSSILCSS